MRPSSELTSKLGPSLSIRRWFWLSMLLLHGAALPSLLASLAGEAGLGVRLALLTRLGGQLFVAAFFVLKIVDVPWLRLKPGWRSVVTAVVIVAVAHVGAVDRALGGDFLFDPAHLGLTFFVGSVCVAELLWRGMRLAPAVQTPVRLWRSHRWDVRLGRAWETAFQPFELAYLPSFRGPRAPPVV